VLGIREAYTRLNVCQGTARHAVYQCVRVWITDAVGTRGGLAPDAGERMSSSARGRCFERYSDQSYRRHRIAELLKNCLAFVWQHTTPEHTFHVFHNCFLFILAGIAVNRLEDKIRDLCSKLVSDADNQEMTETARLLNCALQEHVKRMRERMSTSPPPIERRMHSGE